MDAIVWRPVQRLSLWLGILLLAYAGSVTAYREAYQRYLSWSFDHHEAAPQGVFASTPGHEAEETADLHEGDLVGKLEIPRIGLSVMVLQGVEEQTLMLGAGHVPGTPLPGAEGKTGNTAIAAHRDTFFRKLKGVLPGDSIRLSVSNQNWEYVVSYVETVDPEETRIMESRDFSELTLITCYPFYFIGAAPKRFIVHARMLNQG